MNDIKHHSSERITIMGRYLVKSCKMQEANLKIKKRERER
jgi:hypothetical protein